MAADLLQGRGSQGDDVERVVADDRVGGVPRFAGGLVERGTHVHRDRLDSRGTLRAEPTRRSSPGSRCPCPPCPTRTARSHASSPKCGTSGPYATALRRRRCPLLRPDPAQRHRLLDIRDNLIARIDEARNEGWLGEVEGLQISLNGARSKLLQLDQLTTRSPIGLGIPTQARP